MYQAGLVLEGGGMKGIYTCGVLDFFLDKKIEFSSCYGVSAGACAMASYLSRQRGRAYHVNVDYLEEDNYCSSHSLLTTGDLFNVEMCYHTIPEQLNPYDYEAFNEYQGKAYSVVTNVETGLPEYLQVQDMLEDIDAIRASASLPLVSRIVSYHGGLYLDGGISDSIPVKQAFRDGNRKNVVILTKEIGFQRKPASTAMKAMIKIRDARYPRMYPLIKNRYLNYNGTMEYLEEKVSQNKAFVIRPSHKSDVGRIEKDKERLQALYEEGYEDAAKSYDDLLAFLQDQTGLAD